MRGNNGFSGNPITYHDIDAYMRLTQTEIDAWDVAQIRQMDEVMLKAARVSAAREAKAAARKH